MNRRRRIRYWLVLGVLASLLLVIIAGINLPRGPHGPDIKIRAGMYDLAGTVQLRAMQTRQVPPFQMNEIILWLSDYQESGLERTLPNSCLCLDQKNKKVYDKWGQPLEVLVISDNDYAFVSFGPNQKDDNGKKDDIVYHFDPLELLEKAKVDEPNE